MSDRKIPDFGSIYERYSADVWRVCVLYFGGNKSDAEDALQSTFLRLIRQENPPQTEEHIKAWLIVTAGNICKDMLKRSGRSSVSLDALGEVGVSSQGAEEGELLKKLLLLPPNLKTAIYLYYYEQMDCKSIAAYMKTSPSTVYWYLHKGRKRLKSILEANK